MFEIGIFCVIFLAVAYWTVLWLMGRREDVLHGEFVESEPPAEEPVRPVQKTIAPSFAKARATALPIEPAAP